MILWKFSSNFKQSVNWSSFEDEEYVRPYISVGDAIEVLKMSGMDKRGNLSAPKDVLVIQKKVGTVTLPAKGGTSATVAVEDVRLVL